MNVASQCRQWSLVAAASVLCTGCFFTEFDCGGTGTGYDCSGLGTFTPCAWESGVTTCEIDGFPVSFFGADATVAASIYDPLILEVPAGAMFFNGLVTRKGDFIGQSLQFTTGLASIPIDRSTTLIAEPGTQLVIVDFPPAYKGAFDATISLHYVDVTHSPAKAMFAAKVTVGGATYYAPLLPCAGDFASVPAVSPAGLSLAQLPALMASVTACDHKVYDFGLAAPPPAVANYQGLWWNSPANSESGWGVNLAHQGDTIFATWFTYDTGGKGWWLVVTLNKSGANTYTGDLYTVAGPRFDAFDPTKVVATKAGTATLSFTDANNGTFHYVVGAVNQTKNITREVFGPMPTCSFGTVADLTTATNYQDLWWNKPANSESGWGINLNHEGDTIFATWFTYDIDGTPLWLVVTANKTGPGVYSGDLYRTSGAHFDAFNPANVVATKVGSATFTFADGNDATFDYTVQLASMAAPVHQQKQITREVFTAPGTTCK